MLCEEYLLPPIPGSAGTWIALGFVALLAWGFFRTSYIRSTTTQQLSPALGFLATLLILHLWSVGWYRWTTAIPPGVLVPGTSSPSELALKLCPALYARVGGGDGGLPDNYDDLTKVQLGSEVFLVRSSSFPIITFESESNDPAETALELVQNNDGGVLVNAYIRDSNDDVIAELNESKLNPAWTGVAQWSDTQDELTVLNRKGEVFLNVQHKAKNVIQITGQFHKNGYPSHFVRDEVTEYIGKNYTMKRTANCRSEGILVRSEI